ncbi:polyketide cyclase [Mycolicibacterium peregrinum]|uniref:Polyketide cyclase n=1 Tax=Mycolicibacterium peregrinum TaxID=43304 RepID=A0A1A0QMA8_MYCPR|nr:SRPBCC domain-containing protein [Mycolicibacterium peregrinum]OBB23063.1 polyketide cyclase [Mycolicibacterium peregrinum]
MSDLPIPGYDPSTLVRSITVEIDAPASVVWQVLTDLDKYPQWNPFCISAVSTLEMGAAVEMVLADYSGAGGTSTNTEYVCALVPERLLSWELPATPESPYPARRDQVIEPIAEHRCRYYSTDAFLGDHAHQVMAECGAWVKRAFDDTAVALKKRSEHCAAVRAFPQR